MISAEVQTWRDRWKLINELEEELRKATPNVSICQLNALYRSLDAMGWRQI